MTKETVPMTEHSSRATNREFILDSLVLIIIKFLQLYLKSPSLVSSHCSLKVVLHIVPWLTLVNKATIHFLFTLVSAATVARLIFVISICAPS